MNIFWVRLVNVFLRARFGEDAVASNGSMVHLKYPIVGYDSGKREVLPRTGYVQIDFNIGLADWERIYHFSPGDSSAYKGAHRNLAIAAITTVVDIEKSEEVDVFNRPVMVKRWKWSPHGFKRVLRTSQREKYTNIWMKKQLDEDIFAVIDANTISGILFPVDGKESDIDCLETIMDAVKRNYGMVDQERIWRRMAENFNDWKYGKDFNYPIEILRYFHPNDK